MSTGRKSQLEKFQARQAKARGVSHAIEEQKAKAAYEEQHKSITERGGDFVEKVTEGVVKREDVYAVMTREGMSTFMNMWNNSMESVIKETIREQVKPMVQDIVRDVIQEELQAAIKGVFSGMTGAMIPTPQPMNEMVKQTPEEIQEELQRELHGMPLSQRVKLKETTEPKKVTRTRRNSVDWSNTENAKMYLFSLLEEAEVMGVDINSGKTFKKIGGKFNTAYQKGLPTVYGGGKGSYAQLLNEYRNRSK